MSEEEQLTDFDWLVEQQDQALARDGVVSAFTQRQWQAYVQGKPIPHVWNTPAVQRATARLRRTLKRSRKPEVSCDEDDEDDLWFDSEYE